MAIKKILCPIDLSELSIVGLQQAAELAKEYDAELVVMHVSNDFFRADKTSEYYTGSMNTFLDDVQQLKRLVRDLHDLKSHDHHCLGNPPFEIVEFAKKGEFDLIVISSHGRSGFKKMLLGSVAEKVINSAETSVLVVRESDRLGSHRFRSQGVQPILIPFDFSDACISVLRYARQLELDAKRLHVVHVSEPKDLYHEKTPSQQKRDSEILARNRTRFYEECCPVDQTDVEFRTLFDLDIPGCLSNYALEIEASLILMPTNQKSFLTRFFLGSVANTLAQTAPCPTLIVKGTAEENAVSQLGEKPLEPGSD